MTRFAVRFLLSTNRPGSVVRLTTDTANIFSEWGIPVTVTFPAVEWWDFKMFALSRLRGARRWVQILRLAAEAAWRLMFKTPWCGYRYHRVDPRVRTARYGLTPSAADWTEREITVVHPPYLVPHVLRSIPHPRVKFVSALHMDLQKAVRSSSEEAATWYRHWVARERLVSVPRYTTSVAAKEAAEQLGIRVRKVIPDGVDLTLFHPPVPRPSREGVVVTLYCVHHAQKGQADGLEALRSLKTDFPKVRLCAVGHVLPGHESLFDVRHGYLHQEEYARVIRESDIFVYPSRYDGFPAPPLQAMASGCALVTTAVAGVTDYVVSGENSLVVQPGDVAGLRRSVENLIRDPGLRQRLQAQAVRAAQAFDIRATSRLLLDFLEEVYNEETPTL